MQLTTDIPSKHTFSGWISIPDFSFLDWRSDPYYCPHCGQGKVNLHRMEEFHCEPLDDDGKPLGDPLHQCNPTEWQCFSDECQGRSFWA